MQILFTALLSLIILKCFIRYEKTTVNVIKYTFVRDDDKKYTSEINAITNNVLKAFNLFQLKYIYSKMTIEAIAPNVFG